ncbi:hypothetical protein [Methylobacterium radiotolerans]|uniref:hypothetical protein n=1 Tax=Methylobacterium radiotolerans TaxID=31998 RepID=UPI0038D05FEC
MRNKRSFAVTAAVAMTLGLVAQTTAASAASTSCLPPIDDCQFKWYAEPGLQLPGGEGSEMQGSGGTNFFTWRKVALSFDPDRMLVPLDADAYPPCENRGGSGEGYSQGGGQ